MDWLKELLKKLGVEDSKIDGAIADAGKEIPKHFVPKSQYNDVSTAKQQAEKDVAERDKQIEDLSKAAGLSDDLKKQIDQLKTDNKTAKDKYDADLQQIKLDNAITAVLTGKVHNEKVVTGLIDKTRLIFGDDGNLVGLDEQLTGLKVLMHTCSSRKPIHSSNSRLPHSEGQHRLMQQNLLVLRLKGTTPGSLLQNKETKGVRKNEFESKS